MPDSIKFTELPSGTLSANSIFATAEEAGGGSYASTKINAANLGNYLVGALQYAGINTEDKTVEGALNELLTYASNLAEEYDSTATYDEGDFVIYEGVLYKCTTAISTPEAWTPAHWTSTLVVDNFGSGGATVTLGTSAPLDASGENGDLYVQYESLTYKVVEYFVKINNSWRKSPYSRVVALTQAEYDLITPDPTTLYIITDAQSSYQTKQDSNLQTTADTIVGAINELNTDLSEKANIENLFFGNDGVGYKSISGDATLDSIIDNNISSAGMFSINHGGYITGLVTTVNRQFIYGWANSNRQYSWCLICTFGGIWYCKRENSLTYTATKLI